MLVVQELNILGVKMPRSSNTSRNINGEDLAQRVKDTIVGYKAGRFLRKTQQSRLAAEKAKRSQSPATMSAFVSTKDQEEPPV